MPRRNAWLLIGLALVALVCHLRSDPYARILGYALDQIERRALVPVAREKLLEGALAGMMGRLGDPHSVFITQSDFEDVRVGIEQEFGGVGIEIVLDPETKQLMVASPLYGTPAFLAGIRPRDRILRIDGKTTQGMSLEEASAVLKGKVGTPVVLVVQHEGEPNPDEIRIVRAKIQVDSVLGDRRRADGSWDFFLEGTDRIGYVRINQFGERTAEEMRKALAALQSGGARGLVLDLRDDPGGLLPAAAQVCDLFLESGVIVTIRLRDGAVREVIEARPKGDCPRFPMAVLVNRFSASASEIVAACLQDHGRAIIVGERTFGKGTVQELIPLPGKRGTLKLTTSSYWRPSGRDINRHGDEGPEAAWGVQPDPGYEVKLEGPALARLVRWHREVGVFRTTGRATPTAKSSQPTLLEVDPQLAKAVEYINKRIAQSP